ncbi:MAG: hypothetical protein QF724_10195 [Planctomycetota bacterium]|jgi:hypothetical protein|nr:hypothetical protein [Planctomycetota bacterium]MDP6519105.1 hypothetical protein [Planctomycetota bacterium]MDP6839295.1 hypothetical protein [Planctomycetota bacterium]MDP6955865.1 hypothetical protein [Planctomycetota bacterium]
MTKSKDDFGDLEALASKPTKRRLPTWLWFCGGGCLLAILLVILGGIFVFNKIEEATDDETQWALLSEVLSYDERPDNLELMMGMHILNYDQFQFVDLDNGWQFVVVTIEGDDGAKARQELFYDEEVHFPDSVGGQVNFEGLDRSDLVTQGRSLAVVRVDMKIAGILKKLMPEEGLKAASGSMAFIDVTVPDGQFVYLQVQTSGTSERPTDEQLVALISPFDLSSAGEPVVDGPR